MRPRTCGGVGPPAWQECQSAGQAQEQSHREFRTPSFAVNQVRIPRHAALQEQQRCSWHTQLAPPW